MEGTDRAHEPREGERLSAQADAWGGATYERIAESFAPIHAALVGALHVRPGDRFLDVATGTGGVAIPAARAGADVTGQDLSADQLGKARVAAEEAGVSIQFDEGDAQELPYGDESFDVVASAFGVIFAPDQERAAGQLQRVLRHGGRLGLTAWPLDDWFRLNQRLRPDYEGVIAPRWAEEDHARSLLPEVDLAFDRAEWVIEAGSFDAIWDLLAASVPPLKAWLDTLDGDQRAAAKQEYKPLLGDGVMRREYVRILGTRR